MNNLFFAWQNLLINHVHLLTDMERSVRAERKALLSGDYSEIKEASLQKDKATRKSLVIQDQIKELRTRTAASLNLTEDISLQELFTHFIPEQQKTLFKLRQDLQSLSKQIDRLNKFNSQCIQSYLDHIGGVKSLLSLVTQENRTYRANGVARYADVNQGNYVNRSL